MCLNVGWGGTNGSVLSVVTGSPLVGAGPAKSQGRADQHKPWLTSVTLGKDVPSRSLSFSVWTVTPRPPPGGLWGTTRCLVTAAWLLGKGELPSVGGLFLWGLWVGPGQL